jgi:hypothetical protein
MLLPQRNKQKLAVLLLLGKISGFQFNSDHSLLTSGAGMIVSKCSPFQNPENSLIELAVIQQQKIFIDFLSQNFNKHHTYNNNTINEINTALQGLLYKTYMTTWKHLLEVTSNFYHFNMFRNSFAWKNISTTNKR